uniref:Uncharacterized protein n=1 Tax=Anguilla anguilla TaxID=7936 RepID=A0A0E9SE89_ANGAN
MLVSFPHSSTGSIATGNSERCFNITGIF